MRTHRLFSCALSLLLLTAPLVGTAQSPEVAMTARQALTDIKALTLLHPEAKALHTAAEGAYPVAWVDGQSTIGFIGQLGDLITAEEWFAWAEAEPAITPGTCRYGIASFRLDAYHLDLIDGLPMDRVELASKAVPDLERARVGTRVDSVHAGYDLPQAFHGEGVLIGVLDWGFDYTHPNFYDTTLTSTRIRGAWDQYRQSGPAPAGFDYGTVAETPADLMAMGSDTANVYSYSTHGTHVAGIAGGSGCGIGLHGMAPAAEFLFATLMVDEASALDAFAWMQDIAEADNKRLVINNSWGLPQWGTPDGASLSNQFIDAMSDEGVVFVTSNGNNGDSDFHFDHTFTAPGDTVRSLVTFYPLSSNPNAWGQSLHLWGEPGRTIEASLGFADGAFNASGNTPWILTEDGPGIWEDEIVVNGDDTVFYDVVVEQSHPANGRPFIQIRVHKGQSNVNVILQVTSPLGEVHAWNHTYLTNDVGNWGYDFSSAGQPGWTAGDPFYGVQHPASSQNVIAVGAHSADFVNSGGNEIGGQLAFFSSFGPTLDGRLKPSLSGPGVNVESSLSSFRDGAYNVTETFDFEGTTYEFARLSGTSMSSPAVAGIVALMLEANPALSSDQVRTILEETAREDNNTGTLPEEGDPVWGHGKVTATAAIQAALALNTVSPETEATTTRFHAWPNPAQDHLWIIAPSAGHLTWTLMDLQGRTVQQGTGVSPLPLDLSRVTPGVQLIRLEQGRQAEVLRLVKQP